jgi:hypothetical protein
MGMGFPGYAGGMMYPGAYGGMGGFNFTLPSISIGAGLNMGGGFNPYGGFGGYGGYNCGYFSYGIPCW